MIPAIATRPAVSLPSRLIPDLEASIAPPARVSFTHLSGGAKGAKLIYTDLHAYAWWYGGGWVTLNRGKKGLRRIHRGAEDVTRVQR